MNKPLIYLSAWLAAGLVALAQPAQAQTFWQKTPTSPFGPKRELVATGSSTLLTVVPGGLLRTTDEGRTWALACRTGPVYRLLATRAGHLLAGGRGKVYRSFDAGASWDSVALATAYPVRVLAETPQGDLLAGTGDNLANGEEVGDGVFWSTDQGRSWSAHNQGFGAGRYINQLAVDRQGRLYATVSSAWEYNQPGLYVAPDKHASWQHLPITLRGLGAVKPNEITCLTISPQDSLQCSVDGAVGPVGLSANLVKALADVDDFTIPWRVHGGSDGKSQLLRPLLTTCLFFARNGEWYNSRAGSYTDRYGTLVSTTHGHTWRVENTGLGWSIYGFRNEQFFAELPTGKLFMVQYDDEQVYWRQPTVLSTPGAQLAADFQLFPNPTTDLVQLANRTGQPVATLALLDIMGRPLRTLPPAATTLSLVTEPAGVYLVAATLGDGRVLRQRIVKH